MWFETAAEAGRFLVVSLVCLSLCAPSVRAHLTARRMRQYDLHQLAHGCRGSQVNLEARSLAGWSTSRHCVVARLSDVTVDHFLDVRTRAGAMLVILPKDFRRLTPTERQHLLILENAMAAQEVMIPIYFVPWSTELNSIVDDLSSSFTEQDKHKSALDVVMNIALANGYQIVINGASSQKQESKVATLHGQLMGQELIGKSTSTRDGAKLPTVAIVAHYDSSAIAPELAFGADSNASGVSVLLELARIFSQLYSSPSTRGPVNLVFLLTGAGHMNYYSTKKWIEDQLDSVDGSIIQDASFVLCLDSLAAESSVVMHVSKPPKEGSPTNLFYNRLKQAAGIHGNIEVEGVHKKINLADENLAWEHEKFSIRRLPAFTLSSLKNHKTSSRSTILDTIDSINMKTLTSNTQVIADALAGYLYNISSSEYSAMFSGSLKVNPTSLEAWMQFLSSQPRATEFVSQPHSPVVSFLSETLGKYLPDSATTYYTPEKRDPEFTTYSPTSATLNIYNVKPAIFDLILTAAITLYLCVVYLFIYKFPYLYHFVCNISYGGTTKMYKQQ